MTIANEPIAAYADRLERILDELDAAKTALDELKAEIKSEGFDQAALLKVVAMKRDEKKRKRAEEQLQMLTLYASRLNVQLDLGL